MSGEDAKLYAIYRCCQWAQLRFVQHVASVAVWRRSVCKRLRRNQRVRLKRRRMAPYVAAPYIVCTGFNRTFSYNSKAVSFELSKNTLYHHKYSVSYTVSPVSNPN